MVKSLVVAGFLFALPFAGPGVAVGTSGQSAGTSTCPLWNEPWIYEHRVDEPDNPLYHHPPMTFGEKRVVPAMQIKLLDAETGRKIDSDDVRVIANWRWFQPPGPKHPRGTWTETGDTLGCRMNSAGEIKTAAHEVRPRGWYDGKYMRRPEFTGIAIAEVNGDGHIKVTLKPEDLKRFQESELVIRVRDGSKAEISWEPKDTRF